MVTASYLYGLIAKQVWQDYKAFLPDITSEGMLYNIEETILPVYQDVIVEQGLPVFDHLQRDTYDTLYAVMEQTGYPRPLVLYSLLSLKKLVDQGKVEAVHYNPEITRELKSQPALTDLSLKGVIGTVGGTVDKLTKTILVVGGVYLAVKILPSFFVKR